MIRSFTASGTTTERRPDVDMQAHIGTPASYSTDKPDSMPSDNPRRSPAGAKEREIAEQESTLVSDIWYFLPGVDIERTDKILEAGIEYAVTMFFDPSIAHHRKIGTDIEKRGP